MGVVRVVRHWRGSIRDERLPSGRDYYQVDVTAGPGQDIRALALAHGDIPRRGEGSDAWPGLIVKARDADVDLGPTSVLVTVEYGPPTRIDPPTEPATLQRRTWYLQGSPYLEPLRLDYDGRPMQTTAAEPFDPLPEVERHAITYVFEAVTDTIDLAALEAFANTTNETAVSGWGAAGELLMVGPPAVREVPATEEVPRYFLVAFTIKKAANQAEGGTDIDYFEDNAHALRILNAGYTEIVAGEKVTAKDDAGEFLNRPVMLDDDGARYLAPWFLWRRVYGKSEFNDLPIWGAP